MTQIENLKRDNLLMAQELHSLKQSFEKFASKHSSDNESSVPKLPQSKAIEKPKRMTKRLIPPQIAILEAEFKKDPDWDYMKFLKICKRLKMTRKKIYKWHWDRKKKEEEAQAAQDPEKAQNEAEASSQTKVTIQNPKKVKVKGV